MNIVGALGDPKAVAEALEPLIAGAEDKALAELHASVAVAISALHQEFAATRDALLTRIDALLGTVPTIEKTALDRLETIASKFVPVVTFGAPGPK